MAAALLSLPKVTEDPTGHPFAARSPCRPRQTLRIRARSAERGSNEFAGTKDAALEGRQQRERYRRSRPRTPQQIPTFSPSRPLSEILARSDGRGSKGARRQRGRYRRFQTKIKETRTGRPPRAGLRPPSESGRAAPNTDRMELAGSGDAAVGPRRRSR
jgi:hypothetical protein